MTKACLAVTTVVYRHRIVLYDNKKSCGETYISSQLRLSINWLLLKLYRKMYHQHRLKHFSYQQGVNIFVSISLQLHWHWPFKKTPLTWDICTNLRTCSVKRPCIDKIYNVQVVLRVPPTPRRGVGMGKESGSQEGKNLRDRDRGGSPSPWSLWLSPSFILTSVPTRIANPRSAIR